MEWLRENWFQGGVLIGILLVAAALAYYFVYYIPHRDDAKAAQESFDKMEANLSAQNLKTSQARSLQVCLDIADMNASSYWDNMCKFEGKSTGCSSLLTYHADEVTASKNKDKDYCFKQYPQN